MIGPIPHDFGGSLKITFGGSLKFTFSHDSRINKGHVPLMWPTAL